MRSMTLPLLVFCLGLATCSGNNGRRPSTCGVTSLSDVMVLTERDRQQIRQQSSDDPTVRQKPVEYPQCFPASSYGKGWEFTSIHSSITPFL